MYTAKLVESSREFTARERLMLKDTTNAVRFDDVVVDGSFTFTPVDYAVLEVHNDRSERPDYRTYVILGDDGVKYATSSDSFWKAFWEIWSEMAGETEPYKLTVYKRDSKNYKGKQFLTCSIA